MLSNHPKTSTWVLCSVIFSVTAGCGGSGPSMIRPSSSAASVGGSFSSTGTSGSTSAPTISGTPLTKAQVGLPYSFTPTVQSSSGQSVSFSIQNKPAWASFSSKNGALSGTPAAADVGTDSNIIISVSSSQQSAALPSFAIAVASPPNCTSSNSAAPSGSPASLVFGYSNGFAGAQSSFTIGPDAATFSGSTIEVTNGTVGPHEAGAAWYNTKVNIQSFTTDFTFRITPGGYGMTFIIQNDPRGTAAHADANGIGYFAYSTNNPGTAIADSIGIVFNATPNGGGYTVEANPSLTGLYIDGGLFIDSGISPVLDLTPQGINLQSGDVMEGHITYDGTILTMVLTDTNTGAQARFSWPVDIPAIVGADTAYVGFGAGTIPAVAQTLNSWSWWQGINPSLPSPTFCAAAGSYTAPQTVTISGPVGAAIYYTTNGKPPTTASTPYTSPLTVSSSEYVQAMAVESGYTDSPVTGANYSIGSSGTPPIDFPNGFASAVGLFSTAGTATINNSDIQLTDSDPTQVSELGAAWYVVPVNVQNFTTSFTMQFTRASGYGMAFVIQNQNGPSMDTTSTQVSGGPYDLGLPVSGLGYQNTLASVAVKFDSTTSPGNTTGLYTDGAAPTATSLQTQITGITLNSGDPIDVTLTYNGATLSMSMKDTVTGGTFSTSWPVNIPAIVGGDSAYIGFTGTTNWNQDTIYNISALTFQN